MSKVSPLVDSLIEAFQCLPGVGPKSAQRMVLHLLERNKNAGLILANTLSQALENVDKCTNCRIFTESSLCQICSNEKRNKNQICVVESVSDVFAIEQSNLFSRNFIILHCQWFIFDLNQHSQHLNVGRLQHLIIQHVLG